MSNRHLSRTIAMQSLFEWDFRGRKDDLLALVEGNLKEFAPGLEDNGFTMRIVKGIRKHWDEINKLIETYAPEWPLEQITVTDRNVLRVGIYELKFSSEVPPKVAINEAIELAKTFGGDSSGRFVNGVLGTIYKEMEEQGEKISTSEAAFFVLPEHQKVNSATGRVEVSAGGVVYRNDQGEYAFVLIRDGYGKWTFPKGHIEEGESFEVAALEEVKEETGLRDIMIVAPLGTNILTVRMKDGKTYEKPVHYFLVQTTDSQLSPQASGEVQDAQWFSAEEAMEKIGYPDARSIFVKALEILGISVSVSYEKKRSHA